ncbi:hypothetical protein DU508_17580 [Pedobacter chinensis]|uniref:Site-specific integrase n=1 Tax=Pedobacter chinensis TaxID=2282421 RepID=A0A369PS81_9SPHI|nr:hypothetical protein [Pedobacter chinensis]RDC55384.1 hypothetical protein DU508_17580 [Pedobacter chinensis]
MIKNNVIARCEETEFKLSIPTKIDRNNKIVVYFNYFDPNTQKFVQIKQSTGIDRYATPKIYTRQAKDLTDALIEMLKDGYNFVTKSFPDYRKLNSTSTLSECIKVWFQVRDADYQAGKMRKEELDSTLIVFTYFSDFLKKQNILFEKPVIITKTDIDMFMRNIEKERKVKSKNGRYRTNKKTLSKATYNAYVFKLSYFFKWLVSERVINYNVCLDSFRYQTRNLETRYRIYSEEELAKVKKLLKNDPKYRELYIASTLLYTFRLRAAEQLRLKIGWFSFTKGVLNLPAQTLDANGKSINITKNGNQASFKLNENLIDLILDYIGEEGMERKDWFLFGGHGKVGPRQLDRQFFTNKWTLFKKEYRLPDHLKFYALKHTSNYNSYQILGAEGLMQVNRHSSPSQSFDYIKSKQKLKVIQVDESMHF